MDKLNISIIVFLLWLVHFSFKVIYHWIFRKNMYSGTYLINRALSTINHCKTPYELIFGSIPSYLHRKNFSCLYFASRIRHDRNNFQFCSRKCIFFFVGILMARRDGDCLIKRKFNSLFLVMLFSREKVFFFSKFISDIHIYIY